MFHHFGNVLGADSTRRTFVMRDWQVEAVALAPNGDLTNTVAQIYADENGTPIPGNRVVTDEEGNYDFFIEEGVYGLRIYTAAGALWRTQRYLPMYGVEMGIEAKDNAELAEASAIVAASAGAQAAISAQQASSDSLKAQAAASTALLSASDAQAAALILETTTAGGWFTSDTDPELLALPDGSGAFVNTPQGDFYTVEVNAAVATRQSTFSTRWSNRYNGLNMWEYAKGDMRDGYASMGAASTALTTAVDTFSAQDVGKLMLVRGAGVSGRPLATTITAYTNARTVTLANPSVGAVSGAYMYFGTDDTAAINSALALAYGAGIGRVNWGGPETKYLLGGPFVVLGTFTLPDDSTVPFSRYMIRLYGDTQHVGGGATVKMMGGFSYPGGIFGHPFWDGDTIPNFKMDGLIIDCSQPDQYVAPIPANTGGTGGAGNRVWQHGNALVIEGDGTEVSNCTIRDVRGYGILLGGRRADIHHNKFVNIFTLACTATQEDTEFHHNHISGDGYWVAGFLAETFNSVTNPISNVHVHDNTWDYRVGLSPPETAPQYDSDSPEALAARRHTRKAVAANVDGDWPIENTSGITVENETIYDGTINLGKFTKATVRNNKITNRYEDLSEQTSSTTVAITVIGYDKKLEDVIVSENRIDSPLMGEAIKLNNCDGLQSHGNNIRNAQGAGIRLEACSGFVTTVTAIDIGRDDSTAPIDQIGSQSSAVVVYGGTDFPLHVDKIAAVDTRSGGARKIRHVAWVNSGAFPIIRNSDLTGQNITGSIVRDVVAELVPAVPFTVVQNGNMGSENPTFFFSNSVTAYRGFTSFGDILHESLSGPLNIAYKVANGQDVNTSWLDAGGLEYQMRYRADSGSLQFQPFEDGSGGALVANFGGDGIAYTRDPRIGPV